MMHINKIIGTSVGADLSALGRFPDIPIKKFICIIAPLLRITWKDGDAYQKTTRSIDPVVGLGNSVQNERYASGIFNKEEKMHDYISKISSYPCREYTTYTIIPVTTSIKPRPPNTNTKTFVPPPPLIFPPVPCVGVGAIVAVGDGVGDGVGEGVGDGVGEGIGDGVGDGVGEGVGDGVGDGVGE